MKVLHVISSIEPSHGGVSEGLRQLAETSMGFGCPAEVVTLDEPGQAFLNQFPFPVHALGQGFTHFHYNPRLRDWLFTNIQSYDVVVVHALWQYHSVAVRQAALKFKVPYVVYTHGMLDPYFKKAYPFKHARKWLFWPWADYRVLRDANMVLFTTEEERRLARQSFWLYSANEVVVNLGTTRPPGNPEVQRAAFYRARPELLGKRLVLFLGRIHHKKGCDLAIQSFAQVFGGHPEWQLVMAGPDQTGWRAELSRLAATLGISHKVTWTGMLSGDEKWGALRAAEFFFLPSHQENFGVAVAEALACGVPVLISDKVNIWREVKESKAGLIAADSVEGAVSLLNQWVSLGTAGQGLLRSRALPCFNEKFEIHRATGSLMNMLCSVVPVRASSDPFVVA
jgi:glycosyltransferase involved in cell wall biosynthesis